MRHARTALMLALAAVIVLTAQSVPAAADATRILKLDLAPTGAFAVENLAGTMLVTAGTTDRVTATVTVHAENDEIANLVRFEQVSGEAGVTTLRVIYPTDKYSTLRYPRDPETESSWIHGWLAGWFHGSSSTIKYAGTKVKVSDSSGVLLYANVEVKLPPRSVEGTFRNFVGQIRGRGVEGTLMFDGASGSIDIEKLKGSITADTGSGDVKATELAGSFSGETGSGDIALDSFSGESVKCETGSGDIHIRESQSRGIEADTGSGDIHLESVDVEQVDTETGSGDVTVEVSGTRLAKVRADTGSGDVTLALGTDATFEAMAELGSGDLISRFDDAEPIKKDKEIVGYRRGDARTRIDVQTGSGDCVLTPRS